MRSQHPGIFQIGRVDDDGVTVVIAGWGLALCPSGCPCHRHPANGHLYVAEDMTAGTLGLRSFVDNACGCCSPWTADELTAALRDLASVERVPTTADPRG